MGVSAAPRPLGAIPFLDTPLDKLLGPRTAAHLAKQGVRTAGDLLHFYPRRYDTWEDLTNLATLVEGEQATVQAQVVRASSRRTRTGRPPALLEAQVTDGTSTMSVVMFGAAAVMKRYAEQLSPGTTLMLSGKVGRHRGMRQLANPRLQILDDLTETEREELRARPVPIYPASEAMPSWRIATAVRTILDQLVPEDLPDPIPEEIAHTRGLMTGFEAITQIHRPATGEEWRAARKRLRFEEAFVLQAALLQRSRTHARTHEAVAWSIPGEGSLRSRLDAQLPYALTGAQQRAGAQLEQAMSDTHPMQVLLQGDVGSGKTLVALRAMAQVVGAGGQAALLAPTEVLAFQHAASLTRLLGDLAGRGMLGGADQATRVLTLTGSTSLPKRREILAQLSAGEPAIVVGTHALLSDTVLMPHLGLVVVDEQHRFGVAQRDALRERSGITDPATGAERTPHLLVMTATPIPRTVAMTVFGDLDTVVLDELPAGRAPISTHLTPWERENWVASLWDRARREVESGGRVYVVCPRIDLTDSVAEEGLFDAEASEGGLVSSAPGLGEEESRPLAAVTEWVERLRGEPALAGIEIGALTGRMSTADKDAAMAAFASGAAPILVSTTVIEVGVDVPEASMMIILDAERFGLSQLHQLRGRVGRGSRESLCVAVTGAEVGSTAFHRLKAFASTTDGFELAEADVALRSEGNVLGAAQSGRRSDLKLLRVVKDRAVIEQARGDAEAIFAADPELSMHRGLATAIAARLDEESSAYLERT